MITDPRHHQKDLDMGSRNRINTTSRTLGIEIEIEIGSMRMIDIEERGVLLSMCQGGSISAMAMTVALQEHNTFSRNYHLDLTIHHMGVILNLHP
jgi:hypothetical protein